MATSVEDFIVAATADNIRCNNQFEIEATSGITEVDNVLKTAVMFGDNLAIPGRQLNYADVSYKGFAMPLVPTNLTMDNDHTMTIKCDIEGSYRRAFLAWMNSVMNADIEGGSVFEGDRGVNDQSIIRIKLFSKDNKTVNEVYKFFNVRISNVGAVELSYDGGAVATFQVGFRSTYWTIETATEGAITNQV